MAAGCLAVVGNGARAQAPGSAPGLATTATISFDFANPGLTPAAWHLDFDANGLGHYHSQPGEISAPDAHGAMPRPFDQQIEVSLGVREQLLAIGRSHHFFAMPCEARKNKVAFTGRKTASYSGPDGQGQCTYNWSQDEQLMKLANACLAISFTLEEGRKLRLEYLHDRLSLDAELETLATSVKEGSAMELENIAPELRAIASDPAVMKRAQARAAALLATAPSSGETASSTHAQ
jgi:hypothetical protein